ncbi:MAG TPA: redox-regulated ATPase YchF [Candidatus Pacearchaeota archaeon]|nr:redox-regulated ATPase YchF [Candidatus Pacearchaeota archaeon]HPR79975.1 redox-regulated ATPase YchF [Candidatus Pacearchaeota archaeon]
MSLHIGIVGFPNVGKSTLFQLITKKQVDIANYPFCTIDPNVGVVAVPDIRVDKLVELTHSAKKIYTTIEFVDIAGLVEGASKGEGLGNKFLANIREVDAIVYVLRCFKNDTIVNTRPIIDVLKDKEILDMEMILKDLETVEKRLCSLEREVKSGDKKAIKELEVLKKVEVLLKEGKMPSDFNWDEEEIKIIKSYQLLSSKPRLYLLNGEEKDVSLDVLEVFKKNNWRYIFMDVLTESESGDMSPEERESFGLSPEPKMNELIKESYDLLGLITFLTTGSDETRAWTIHKGDKAPQAGGAIHTDFEETFIKAEVINWEKLIECGGFSAAREKGMIRTEGKEYVVQDGDVIEIKSGK